MTRKIILASASPRRLEILSGLGFAFDVVPSHAEELQPDGVNTHKLALENAVRKALDVSALHPESLVIGADTLIEFGLEAIGKPQDREDAIRILLHLAGCTHHVTTGVCLCCMEAHLIVRFAVTCSVMFLPFDRSIAEEYIRLVPVLDKAGAYAIQDHADLIIDHYDGSLSNIIGLPAERLKEALDNALKY